MAGATVMGASNRLLWMLKDAASWGMGGGGGGWFTPLTDILVASLSMSSFSARVRMAGRRGSPFPRLILMPRVEALNLDMFPPPPEGVGTAAGGAGGLGSASGGVLASKG